MAEFYTVNFTPIGAGEGSGPPETVNFTKMSPRDSCEILRLLGCFKINQYFLKTIWWHSLEWFQSYAFNLVGCVFPKLSEPLAAK